MCSDNFDDIDDFFCNDFPLHNYHTCNEYIGTTSFQKKSQVLSRKENVDGKNFNKSSHYSSFIISESQDNNVIESTRIKTNDDCTLDNFQSVSRSRSISSLESQESPSIKRRRTELDECIDETSKFFDELAQETSLATKFSKDKSTLCHPRRVYRINFISNLTGSIGKKINVNVSGNKTFKEILPIVLKTYIQSFKVGEAFHHFYNLNEVCIYRRGVKILIFMNCNSLNIPQTSGKEITEVELKLVSVNNATEYEESFKKQLDDHVHSLVELNEDHRITIVDDQIKGSVIEEYEKDLQNISQMRKDEFEQHLCYEKTKLQEPSIRIGLIGRDNKKVYINVKKSTSFDKISEYYIKTKNLQPTTKLSLIFDNEQLPLNALISNYDIEEDDLIEVKIL